MDRSDRALRQAVADVVGTRALTREAIVDELVVRGVDLGPGGRLDRLARLLQDDTTFAEVGGGVAHVPSLLDGTTWTVWVDADDARHGLVRMHPYLDPLGWWLIDGHVGLLDSQDRLLGELQTDGVWLDERDTDVVLGPEGWLDGLAGGWALVDVVGEALRWRPCSVPPEPTGEQVAALRQGFERAATRQEVPTSDGPVELVFDTGEGPVLEALLVDRAAFLAAAVPPLPALYEAAGLEERGGILAEAGFDWAALHAWQATRRLALEHRLDAEQVDRLVLVVGACQAVASGDESALGADEDERGAAAVLLSAVLEDSAVAEACWSQCLARGLAPDRVGRFAGELVSRLDGYLPAGLAWLQARCLEAAGDAPAAAAVLEAAVGGGCQHLAALTELAGYRADRGDAVGAFRLLAAAGVTERAESDDVGDEADQLLQEVGGYALHRPPPQARRNDPCPCGSGRKYKACHLGREQHSLADRSAWLYGKARRYLRTHRPELVEGLADAIADPGEQSWVWAELVDSEFVADLALHEGEVLQEFLTARQGFLPDDEALLATQWTLVDRSVFEIERVERDRLELFDVGRSERVTVVNTKADARTRAGTLLIGRPLPVGEVHRAFGGFLPVPRAAVRPLLDALDSGDLPAITDELASLFMPPRLQNADGHDLVFHVLRWQAGDRSVVDTALRAAGLRADDDEPVWHLVRDSVDRRGTIVASLRWDDGELVGEVSSDDRAAELRALVATALPGAVLVDDEARALDEVLDDHDPVEAPAAVDQDDPAVQAVLADVIAELERRWLDESIPALGGRTPREAAGDPVGREELRQLLASFPVPGVGEVGAMHPDRLRAALGLDDG